MLKICPCCKYVSNLYQTITFTWLLRINTYLANICICPHFSRQRKCNANLELQIYHIFAPFAKISKSVFSSSVMSHHPGVLILLQVKKKTVGWVSSSSFTREFNSTLLLGRSRAPSTQVLFLGIQRKNTGSNMGSKIQRSISRILGHNMTCERSFCKHGRKRSVLLERTIRPSYFLCSQVHYERTDCRLYRCFFWFFLHSFILLYLFSSWRVVIICFNSEIFIKQI